MKIKKKKPSRTQNCKAWVVIPLFIGVFNPVMGMNTVSSPIQPSLRTLNGIQQNHGFRITGVVTDTHGESIIGANVMVQGTTIGVITDIDGRYELYAESGMLYWKFLILDIKQKQLK